MSESAATLTPGAGADAGPTAGAMLLAGREAAGLTLDAVAQQLKLAPRQVLALERNDFPQLPGRTFIRGFIRNYARLVRIDPELVLAALPDATSAAHGGSLAPSPQSMGELPAEVRSNFKWAHWLVPLAMLAVVGATAYYEFLRPRSNVEAGPGENAAKSGGVSAIESTTAPAAPTGAPANVTGTAPVHDPATGASTGASSNSGAVAGSGTSVALPNPVAAMNAAKVEPAAAERAPANTEKLDAARKGDASLPASAAPATAASGATPATASAAAPILIDFRGTSWVQVKDSTGAIVLTLTGSPGSSQPVTGTAPFDVIIGRVDAVTVTFQGRPVDLSPYLKQNVARLTLK